MLINFYRIFFLLLLLIIVYCNISVPVHYAMFISGYPYLLTFAALFSVYFLVLYFFNNALIIKTTSIIMSFFFIFFIFTFFQIWKNTVMLNDRNIKEENNIMPISLHNEALLIYDSTVMFDEIIEEVSKAKSHIHIEFFILRNDSIGQKIKDLLIKKAKEGVEVRVIYDGLGSLGLKRSYRKELEAAGAEIKAYDSMWQSIIKGKLNHRNHRKIVIVDGTVGFTGGMNIGDEYLGRDNEIGNWKDVLVKIKGEAVNDMQRVFFNDWYYVSGQKLIDSKYFTKFTSDNILPIQIVDGGHNTPRKEVNSSYFSIITSSKERLYIVTPYLVLNEDMVKALKSATARGVDVKIIVPKNPDYFLVGWVNTSFFEELLKNKVKIYLYEDGFLHSKIFVADGNVVSVGSANLNMRSLYLDYEMNAVLFNENTTQLMIKELNKNIENSEEVLLEEYNKRSLIQRFKEKIGVFIRPLV